jgi:ATP-dependent RNA helicase SUPV3L1/SUV3
VTTTKSEWRALDEITGGVFSAESSSDRSKRLRHWLESDPSMEQMVLVFKELSVRDKGAAKPLRERIDELKKLRDQDRLMADWASRAQDLIDAPHLNMADAMAWQRDAAKAGAPLSREPLAELRVKLASRVKAIDELQNAIRVHKEVAVLLGQRIETLSTKPMEDAQQLMGQLQNDMLAWQAQVQAFEAESEWGSVDMKLPLQLKNVQQQLAVVWQACEEALQQATQAMADPSLPLPQVPLWSEQILQQRGVAAPADAATAQKSRETSDTQKQRAAVRALATEAVRGVLEQVESELEQGHGKASVGAAASLRAVLKLHGKHLDVALDQRVHQALIAAGELEGWQRWRADQLRQGLVDKAEALKESPLGGRKLQDEIRQLRQAWKEADQGGIPNHGLWKRFDAACNLAHERVDAWLSQVKAESQAHKQQRQAVVDELQKWSQEAQSTLSLREQMHQLHAFEKRWREAGHVPEKWFATLSAQWKSVHHAASEPLHQAQKASIAKRKQLIEAVKLWAESGSGPIDQLKALQQQWQQEAQSVPLDRHTEQKLWEAFKAPADAAFERRTQEREKQRQAPQASLSEHDRAVLEASNAVKAAVQGGDAQAITQAMAALERMLQGTAEKTSQNTAVDKPAAAQGSGSDAAAAPAAPERPKKPVVAVRGDDRPGQKRDTPAQDQGHRSANGRDKPGRSPREGGRMGALRQADDARAPRGPRLADAAFHAQRDAHDMAQQALRRLAAQAHGEVLVQLVQAWQERQVEQLPSLRDLGKGVSNAARQAWSDAIVHGEKQAKQSASIALLRLELAAQVPTPATHLDEKRAYQLQLLTQRNASSPAQTWASDVADVLASPHQNASSQRLQQALKVLLR